MTQLPPQVNVCEMDGHANLSEKHESLDQLVGDSRRQATSLFKGIDFQIWLTIAAWIELKADQILMVEGVEDFDIVDQAGGIATQVKALAQPISLRSTSVTDTLRNFWQAKHSNTGQKVCYNFVTTAAFTIESGEPFGAGNAGLALWANETKSAIHTEASEKIRKFLTEDETVSKCLGEDFRSKAPPLLEYLSKIDAATFFQEFIRPLSWVGDHAGVDAAKGAVAVTLHAYGENMGLLASDSSRALPHLFTFVAHKAYKEHRVLTREDFRLEFENAVSPGLREMASQSLVLALARQLVGQAGGDLSIPADPSRLLIIPRLPPLCLPRTALSHQTQASVAQHRFAALHGSTGKGKTTLAKLATSPSANQWSWFSFEGLDTHGITAKLESAAKFAASNDAPFLLLDNLDVPVADEARIARKLATLYMVIAFRKGLILVTAKRPLPPAFLRETGLPESVKINIPNLVKEEVQALCVVAGCPAGQQLLAHSAIILTQTGGHPQLVNAAVSTRRDMGWTSANINQILEQAPEVIEERKLARQLLDGLSTDEVELLNRLSLVSMSFRRDQAIIIGEITPPIIHPGNCFDKLVGPWIEPSSGERYRLSSLLTNAADSNYSKDRVMALRGSVGWALVRSSNLAQW